MRRPRRKDLAKAERTRRWRARQACGVQVIPVEVDQSCIESLLIRRAISEADLGDPHKIAQVIARVIKNPKM